MPTSCYCYRTFKVINIRFADIVFGSLPQASFQKVRFSGWIAAHSSYHHRPILIFQNNSRLTLGSRSILPLYKNCEFVVCVENKTVKLNLILKILKVIPTVALVFFLLILNYSVAEAKYPENPLMDNPGNSD